MTKLRNGASYRIQAVTDEDSILEFGPFETKEVEEKDVERFLSRYPELSRVDEEETEEGKKRKGNQRKKTEGFGKSTRSQKKIRFLFL